VRSNRFARRCPVPSQAAGGTGTTIDAILSPSTTAESTPNLFVIGDGRQAMRLDLKWQIGRWPCENMLTVFWNSHGFHVVTTWPPRGSRNASWSIEQKLMTLIATFFELGWNPGQRKLSVNLDKAAPHNSRMTHNWREHEPLRRLLNLPYSLDPLLRTSIDS
jgi:hypothetical protein